MRLARSANIHPNEGNIIMSNVPDRAYIDRRTAQLQAAVTSSDGELAVGIMQLIAADGYPDLAAAWTNDLIERGLQSLAAKAGAR